MQLLSWCNIYPDCCYLFLGSYKKKKIQKIYIKKYSKEILKIIGARKGCWNTEKKAKIGWGGSKIQKVKIWQYIFNWWELCWQGKLNLRKKSLKSDIYGLD